MISALTLSVLTTVTAAPAAADAPVRLITKHGVELVADEQVFVLFAALNALGYAEETRRKGPPLRAPVFHPIRVEVQDALRAVDRKGGTAGIRRMFDEHPAEIEVYLEAILASHTKVTPRKGAAKLRSGLQTLEAFRADAELTALFDKIAEEQRTLGASLKRKIERDFDQASKLLGVKGLRAPRSMVVVPNPLDGHDVVRSVTVGNTKYLVVGPSHATAQHVILKMSIEPLLAEWSKSAYVGARRFKKHWEGLSTSKRITRRYPTGERYLAASLAETIAYIVHVGKRRNKDRDEDFIDEQAKEGLRWARVSLKMIDEAGSASFQEALPKLLATASP